MSRLITLILLLICLVLSGCPKPMVLPRMEATGTQAVSADSRYAMHGRVERAFFESRRTQATMGEIANAATVSLIRTDDGVTVASSRTTAEGTFLLTFGSSFVPDPTRFYILEAVKGLSGGALPNRAGAAAARVRTLLKWNNGWISLTQGGITIARSTTTIAVIHSLRQFSGTPLANPDALIDSVVVSADSSPDTFTPGSSGIQQSEYDQVLPLVSAAILFDEDPVAQIIYNTETLTYSKVTTSIGLSGVSPTVGRIGDLVTIYGSNFVSDVNQNVVQFNGVRATDVSRNTLGSELTVRVPVGATSGPLVVQIGTVVFGGLSFQVLSWDGHTPFDSSGNLYVAGYANNAIFRVSPAGLMTRWVQGAPLNGPRSIVVGPDDTVYVSNYDGNTITRISPTGVMETYASGGGLSNPWGLALRPDGVLLVANGSGVLQVAAGTPPLTPTTYSSDAALGRPAGLAIAQNGDLYVSNWSSNTVSRVASGSLAVTTPITGLANPAGLAMDSYGNLVIADYGNNAVLRYSTTGALTTYLAAVGTHAGPIHVAYDPSGTLFVGNWDSHTLYSVNPQGGIRHLALAPRTPWGITKDSNNDLYVTVRNSLRRWESRPRDTRVYRVRYNNGNYGPFEVVLDGFNEPIAAAFDTGNQMYVADWGTRRIYTADPTTVARQIWLEGVSAPSQMSFDPANNLYVARWRDNAYRISPARAITPYHSGRNYYGGAYDGAGNLYLTSETDGYLVRVTPTGATSVIATGLSSPAGIVFNGGTLYVAERGANRVSTYSTSGARGTDLSSGGPLNGPSGITFDGTNFYVSNWNNGAIVRIPSTGGTGAAMATAPGALRDIVVTGGFLYGTYWSGQSIVRIALSDGTVTSPFCSLPTVSGMGVNMNPWGIATDGTTLYVTIGNNQTVNLNAGWSGIYQVPIAAPSATRLREVNTTWLSDILLTPSGGLSSVNYNQRGLNGYAALLTDTAGGSPLQRGSYLWQASGVAWDGVGLSYLPWFGRALSHVNRIASDGSWTRTADLGMRIATTLYADTTNQDLYVCSVDTGLRRFSSAGTQLASYSGTGESTGITKLPNGDLVGTAAQSAVQGVPLFRIPSGQSSAQVMSNWPYRPGF